MKNFNRSITTESMKLALDEIHDYNLQWHSDTLRQEQLLFLHPYQQKLHSLR